LRAASGTGVSKKKSPDWGPPQPSSRNLKVTEDRSIEEEQGHILFYSVDRFLRDVVEELLLCLRRCAKLRTFQR